MYIVLRVPYTCNLIAMIVLCKVSIVEAIKYQNQDANRFAVLTVLCFVFFAWLALFLKMIINFEMNHSL